MVIRILNLCYVYIVDCAHDFEKKKGSAIFREILIFCIVNAHNLSDLHFDISTDMLNLKLFFKFLTVSYFHSFKI